MAELRLARPPQLGQGNRNRTGADLQRRAWQWANSDVKITATVPLLAATGPITVTTSGGTVSTTAKFTVTPSIVLSAAGG